MAIPCAETQNCFAVDILSFLLYVTQRSGQVQQARYLDNASPIPCLQRKRHKKGASLTFCTLDPDPPSMPLYNLPGHIQPNAETTNRSIHFVCSIKALEDVVNARRRDTCSLIFHPDQHFLGYGMTIIGRVHTNLDIAASGTILYSIINQIAEYLLYPRLVKPSHQAAGRLKLFQLEM